MKLIIQNGLHGRGVFAGEGIGKGRLIMPFTGPFLRKEQTTAETYALQIGPDLYIGGSGGMDDCVNHSCDPNAGMVIVGREANLVAIRDIQAGEEICFDYSTTLDEDDFEFDCRCGAAGCRGRIGDGKRLPEAVWRRYLELGILPEYVQRSRARLLAGQCQ